MAIMLAKTDHAFKAAGAPEDDAIAAADELADQSIMDREALRLPVGSPFPDELRLWEDDPGHYIWEPAMNMPLANYVSVLASVVPLFVKV